MYPAEHYAWWCSVHGYELLFGAFSENLTVEGARELALYHGRSTDRVLRQKLLNMPEFADEGKRELTRRLG